MSNITKLQLNSLVAMDMMFSYWYWHTKQNVHLEDKTTKRIVGIEESIWHLGFDYFFVGMIKQPVCPPIVKTILVLWNMKFDYYKEQLLKWRMVKHKFEVGSSSRAKQMKFKTKDTILEIQPTLLDQIYFPTCTYITIWATKKEEHGWCSMIFVGLIGTQLTYLWSRRSFVTFKFPMEKHYTWKINCFGLYCYWQNLQATNGRNHSTSKRIVQ
jgi:hypothetical protein